MSTGSRTGITVGNRIGLNRLCHVVSEWPRSEGVERQQADYGHHQGTYADPVKTRRAPYAPKQSPHEETICRLGGTTQWDVGPPTNAAPPGHPAMSRRTRDKCPICRTEQHMPGGVKLAGLVSATSSS